MKATERYPVRYTDEGYARRVRKLNAARAMQALCWYFVAYWGDGTWR